MVKGLRRVRSVNAVPISGKLGADGLLSPRLRFDCLIRADGLISFAGIHDSICQSNCQVMLCPTIRDDQNLA